MLSYVIKSFGANPSREVLPNPRKSAYLMSLTNLKAEEDLAACLNLVGMPERLIA